MVGSMPPPIRASWPARESRVEKTSPWAAASSWFAAASMWTQATVTVSRPAAGWVAWVGWVWGFWSVMTWLLSSVERYAGWSRRPGRMALEAMLGVKRPGAHQVGVFLWITASGLLSRPWRAVVAGPQPDAVHGRWRHRLPGRTARGGSLRVRSSRVRLGR